MSSARIISRGAFLLRSAKPSIPRIPTSTFTRASPASIRSNLITLFNKSQTRFNSSCNDNSNKGTHIGQLKVEKPMLMISFTCKKCDTRSSHAMSKQAYTGGTVLIKCPGCANRHLIADHLKIFSDERITVEDILSAKGESVSQDTNDLVFEEIPDKLKGLIGHHAPDAPESHSKKENETDQGVSPQIEAPKKD